MVKKTWAYISSNNYRHLVPVGTYKIITWYTSYLVLTMFLSCYYRLQDLAAAVAVPIGDGWQLSPTHL